ncbi:MAG TPA: M23 family metallopeptidase [Geobacteraceae bacterium]|nr:M23 family metallopeptidase [Geobacteraceae bacterium]
MKAYTVCGLRSAVCLLICLALPALAVCSDTGSQPATDGNDNTASPAAIKKEMKKKKGKKPNLNDPATLAEIAEKSVAAGEGIGTGQAGENLDLPVKGRITSTVGLRPDPINGDIRMHNGVDIAIPEGTPVSPVAPGRIAYSGLQPGYGNMVIVQHDDGMISIYAHHSRNLVKTGEKVKKETRIALSGSTGHSTGPHLHFEAWQGGINVTSAFLPSFAGRRIEESTHGSLETTNLRKVIMSDGTILFVEVARKKSSTSR